MLDRRHSTGFSRWLYRQQHRDDPVGDLSKDSLRDSTFPQTATDPEEFRIHLTSKSAERYALKALDEAWAEYSGGLENHP